MIFAPDGAAEPQNQDDSAFSRLYFGLQPPTDRESERAADLALSLLADGRSSEAAPLLAARFAARQDSLRESGASLKGELRAAVASIDPASRRRVRAVLEGDFRRRLAEARGLRELRSLVAAHPAEIYGPAALAELARAEEDAGALATATEAYRRARLAAPTTGTVGVATKFATREAACRLRLGETIDDLPLPPDFDAAWLQGVVSAAPRSDLTPQSWAGAGGDRRRLAAAPGQTPSPWPDWRVDFRLANQTGDEPSSAGANLDLPVVAARGVLVTATEDALLAIDASSGKRAWRVGLQPGDSVRGIRGLATDGHAVFAVTPSRLSAGRDPRWNSRQRGALGAEPNALSAHDLATGGRLLWRLDGGDSSGPLSGAAMLGPPAASEGRLYSIIERDEAICLTEIDARTGSVDWVQTLVVLQRQQAQPASSVSVTPTIADGVIYCPTGRGAVVAVDPIARQIVWIKYRSVDEASAEPPRAWRGLGRRGWLEEHAKWRHCRVVAKGERVAVVSPASPMLEVLDAQTGEPVWTRKHDKGLYLATIAEQTLVVVEQRRLVGRQVADGAIAWSGDFGDQEQPAGEGLLLGGHYVAPVSSPGLRVAAVEPREGESLRFINLDNNPFAAPAELGGLIYYRGAIYSRSPQSISCYRQPQPGSDPLAVATEPLLSGEYEQAERRLREFASVSPEDRRASERLAVAALRKSLVDGSPPSEGAEAIRTLAAGPRAEAYVALLQSAASIADRDLSAAVEVVVNMAVRPCGSVLLPDGQGGAALASQVALGRLYSSSIATPAQVANTIETSLGRLGPSEARAARLLLSPPSLESRGPASQPAAPPVEPSLWSLRQIAATVEVTTAPVTRTTNRRSRRERSNSRRPLRVLSRGPGTAGQNTWWLESRGGNESLIGINAWGEPVLPMAVSGEVDLPEGSEVRKFDPARHLGWGDWLAVALEEGFAVFRVDPSAHGAGPVWTSNEPNRVAWRSANLAPPGAEASPVAIGPWGVVGLAGRVLSCHELTSGVLRWTRQLEGKLGQGTRVFCDDHALYVAGARGGGTRLSPWSGQSIGDWRAPAVRDVIGVYDDRLILTLSGAAGGRELRLSPLDGESSEPVWRRRIPATARMHVSRDGLLSLLTEELRLSVVDLNQGEELFTTDLPSESNQVVRMVRVRRTAAGFLVEIDRSNTMVDRSSGVSAVGGSPLLTGDLHLLDARTGLPIWKRPVEVAAMSVLEPDVDDLPVLLLGRRLAAGAENDQAESTLSLVAIDLLTGATLYRNHAIPAGDESRGPKPLRVQREHRAPAGPERLIVRMGRVCVTLETTDAPAAPRPPMLARIEDPYATRTRDERDIERGLNTLFKSLFDND